MGSARWYRLSIGLVLVVVALFALLSRLDAIWNGHPAYPTTLFVTIGIGLTLIGFALWPWRRDPEPDGQPWETDDDGPTGGGSSHGAGSSGVEPTSGARRGGGWRIAGRIIGGVGALLLVAALLWLRPYTAEPDGLAALRSDDVVTVIDKPTTIELSPATLATPTVGLVFSPGVLVDARAYAALLRSVAEEGYLVVILKVPFGLAITQIGQSAGPIADHPEISFWAVGGHSLGGVAASSFAGSNPDTVTGLVLWASFPNGDLSGMDNLQAASIFGSSDLLATPTDIEDSKARLPVNTIFTEIDGGIHAYFADYGEQAGDGQPGIDRATASVQIVAATADLLARLPAAVTVG